MLIRIFFAMACIVFVAGCSKSPGGNSLSSAPAAAASATISTFPTTLEGQLVIGNSNDWGYFGDITVNGIDYPVAIPGSTFEAAGIPDAGGKVRIVVDSKEDVGHSFQYIVSSITKL